MIEWDKVLTEDELQTAEILRFKIIDQKYIDLTRQSGEINFGCAEIYAKPPSDFSKGNYDKDEGLFARVSKDNHKYIKEQEDKYKHDLIKIENGKLIDLKLYSVMNIPTFCYYALFADDPEINYSVEQIVNEEATLHKLVIPFGNKIINDFSNGPFGIVWFQNNDDFYSSIKLTLGRENIFSILSKRIEYVDRIDKEWICPDDHPMELFYKDDSFSYQKEKRLIITDEIANFSASKVKNKVVKINISKENVYEVKSSSLEIAINYYTKLYES